MIAWSATALARIGLTPESADAVLALSTEQHQVNEVQAWRYALADCTKPRPTVLHTGLAIKSYAAMAKELGYSVRT